MSEKTTFGSSQIDIQSRAELCAEVKKDIGNPLNSWVVAASIESLGIREEDVSEFGFESLFELAEAVYRDLKKEVYEEWGFKKRRWEGQLQKPGLRVQMRLFIKYYLQGLVFSLPMVSQIAAIFIFRYSLWAWLDFNEAQATIVACATIIGFVLTGGFIQVLGRSVGRYINQENYFLARRITFKIIRGGSVSVIIASLLFYLINFIIPFYPTNMLTFGLVYMNLIAQLMLASSILYALKRPFAMVGIIILGTVLVIVNMDLLNLGIYFSQWSAMAATIFLLYGYGWLCFNHKLQDGEQQQKYPQVPTPEVSYYINYRYFIYGTAYFLFLFLDRLLAWSTGPAPPPFIIWFNTPYELGMDWALLTLVLSIAVLEYSVHAFSKHFEWIQKRLTFIHLKSFNTYYQQFYLKQVILLTTIGIFSIFITYHAVSYLAVFQNQIPEIRDFFANSITTRVFWIASVSYLFLNIGLLHSLFFFTLNKADYSLYSLLSGLMVNGVVGFLCSRMISLEYATLGLLAGAITFAVVSGFMAHKFFKKLDYYYYSAF